MLTFAALGPRRFGGHSSPNSSLGHRNSYTDEASTYFLAASTICLIYIYILAGKLAFQRWANTLYLYSDALAHSYAAVLAGRVGGVEAGFAICFNIFE